MKASKKFLALGLAASLLMGMGMTAFAAESAGTSSYSFNAGKSAAAARVEAYKNADQIKDEAERKAYLESLGINEEAYSEEAAASYSWIAGQARGSQYADHDASEDTSAYSFNTGKKNYADRHAVWEK